MVKLQMYGVVCFNDFEGNPNFLPRVEASSESDEIGRRFSEAGIKMSHPITNWTTYSLFSNLRKFCRKKKKQLFASSRVYYDPR